MIVKGGARGGPRQLADHLLRTDHNETVTVLHMEGIDAPDLHSALREMHAIGKGAQTRRTLYHANIDPRADERLTREQNHEAVERLAEHLGLTDQAYVVVEHVKNGRHHLHVVWSRIDLETMTAISDSHNYRKHEAVARDLERAFGHERVQGVHHEREGKQRPGRSPTYAEYQQAARAGMTPQQQVEMVTQCWRQTGTGQELREHLEAAGFVLARSDRRDFVIVDHAGEVHSLARRIDGVRAAEVRQRMSDIHPNELPDVDEARKKQLQLKPVQDKGFVSASERLQMEERQRDREGKGPREQLSGTHGEIADAIYHLNKTMRGQMAGTIANSQTHLGREATQQQPAPTVPPKVREEPQPHPNLIQPVTNTAAAQQKLREATGLPRGSSASPQAMERLDKELGRPASSKDRKAEPAGSSELKEVLKWNRSSRERGPNLGR